MVNINLTTKQEEIGAGSVGKEWGFFIVAVILAAIIYGGVFSYNRWLNQDLAAKNEEYQTKYNSLMEKGESVFDFQNRLEAAKLLVVKKNYALESLGQIEKAIVREVYVESFDFDSEKGQINLTCITQDYRLMANQVASLKKMNYFSEIVISNTVTRDDGKIEFTLGLTIKGN